MKQAERFTWGLPYPVGATPDPTGVNFAVFSAHATKIELCLFDETGENELERLPLMARTGDIWHMRVDGLKAGQLYGYRVHGPYEPHNGHRFNPHKLLIDPYAKALHGEIIWHEALLGYDPHSPELDLSFSTLDSAAYVPKSVVVDPAALKPLQSPKPQRDLRDTVVYEAHVKGLTQEFPKLPAEKRGKFAGVADEHVLDYLQDLGVSAIELLPVHAFQTEKFLCEKGMENYWGYQTYAFFAPDQRYMVNNDRDEFRAMVDALHDRGLEVYLDVVYNHTAEGDEYGATICHRGFDNLSYYRLAENKRHYINDTGTGNTLNLSHPSVLRMVMDSLRYWTNEMGVDGFRFDLATVLAREAHGFDPLGGFIDAISQEPSLQSAKLIAEPWDIGLGGYQLGAWPAPFLEWNDKYRDDVRSYWRGDPGLTGKIAKRLLGSAEVFDHDGRHATSSVNFITAHDGFTLHDLVTYSEKHNEANQEGNRDGHNHNFSDNFGVEGETDDAEINAARARRQRNMLATLMFSQGTPMLLAGDEISNSQQGNNNAYVQDNEIGWINWDKADVSLLEFTKKLIRIRKENRVLRQRAFLHSRQRPEDDYIDLYWRRLDGKQPTDSDWENPEWKVVCVEMRISSHCTEGSGPDDVAFLVLNKFESVDVVIPAPPQGFEWHCILDTSQPDMDGVKVESDLYHAPKNCLLLFVPRAK